MAVSSKAGVRGKGSAEAPSFALGWFADSGEESGEERLWLEEQMLVADGVKDKVSLTCIGSWSGRVRMLCIADLAETAIHCRFARVV